MSRQFADQTPRPMDEPPPDDRKRELLKEVLSATQSATFEAQKPMDLARWSRFEQVADRWRGSPWSAETIGASLVGAALHDWLISVKLNQSLQEELIRDITEALFDDPVASIKLKSWWQEIQESNK